jgi:hypothetical protein
MTIDEKHDELPIKITMGVQMWKTHGESHSKNDLQMVFFPHLW